MQWHSFNLQGSSAVISVNTVFVHLSLSVFILLIEIAGCYLFVCTTPLQRFNSAQWSIFDSWQWVTVNKGHRHCQSIQKCPVWLQFQSGRHPSVFVATTSQLLLFPHNVCPFHFSEEQISLIKKERKGKWVILTNITAVIFHCSTFSHSQVCTSLRLALIC